MMDLLEAKRYLNENGYFLVEARSNAGLNNAAKNKDDEYYTYMKDIEKEMKHYNFNGKIVYCCCDDPNWSNFYKYFKNNFESLGLKGLISSHYENSGHSYWTEFYGDQVEKHPLKGNGDCLSPECRALADKADIIVTNPPFSIFNDIVEAYINKPFIMLCIPMKMCSKTCLQYYKENKLHYGYTTIGSFYRPNGEKDKHVYTIWFTNLKVQRPSKKLNIVPMDEEKFKQYDNFNAVNTDSQKEIPDTDGLIGVPITILWSVDQNNLPFEIIGKKSNLTIDGKNVFARLIVKLK